jgi:hypothetical protein
MGAAGLGAPAQGQGPRRRHGAFAWVPAAVLGAGLLLGLAVWAKWGFAVAFEAIRAYCL